MERGSNIQRGSKQGNEESGRNSPSTSKRGQQRTIPRNPRNVRRWEDRKRQGNNEARGTRRKFPMGFKVLQNLLEEVRDIEEVILELANEGSGFSLLLDSDLKDKPDIIVLITRILNRICEESDKCHLLKNVFVKGKFLKTLKIYISGLEFQNSEEIKKNSYFWNCSEKFWNNLINICKHLNQKYPSIGCEVTPELLNVMQTMIERLEQKHHSSVSDEIKTSITSLLAVSEKLTKFQKERVINKKHSKYVPPTDNFRYMSIYPTTSEITNLNRSFYLNANRIEGKYESIDEYLDVQFRLLREDFVTPLRKGICLYLQGSTEKNHEVRIHPRVQFMNSEVINELCCYRVQCEFNKKKRSLKYEDSKEFMFGSLMCFTRDNFNTVFFGRICKRNVKDLEKGQIIVGFEEDHELIALNKNYLMVECKVYFEPYFHVLNVLQRFPIYKFPMKKYIIDVEQDIDPPLYMLKNDLLLNKIKKVKIFRGLNDSQSSAFKAALTKEFVVIQGPPGTGKTFVGLKIVETLLQYEEQWYHRSPILIICATNHALDQFLEGITSYTKDILRIGGQSKNEKIAEFNIANKARIRNQNGKLRSMAIYEARDDVKDCLYELEFVNNFLDKINKRDCVFDFEVLRDVIPQYEKTWFFNTSKMQILEWLLADREENMEETPFNVEEQLLSINAESEDSNEDADEEIDNYIRKKVSFWRPQIISLETINNDINYLMEELECVRQDCYMTEDEKLIMIQDLYYEIGRARSDFKYLKNKLEESSVNEGYFNDAAYINLLNTPNVIAPDIRWKLYFLWLDRLRKRLLQEKEKWSKIYRDSYLYYNDLRSLEDSQLIKEHLVVGMTTTGAARMHSTLQTIRSPIVIVEEAAEVLEAHIISALTLNCQHLILIGDHQQLKPHTADYNIETNFNLGVSLFERMVQNKIECHTLNVQHRMCPEISALIAPTIYPTLQNHDSVCSRDQINGVEKSLYFIDHQEPEQICNNESKKNPHEAAFTLALAKHLILNGYEAEDITILAAYLGQMIEMNEVRKKYKLLEKVRIAVLDNYQGEENKIILLSLVRSNHENSIGFLKIENRVCVALSRARDGLYIIGNMNLLCANSKIWSEIKKTLVKQDAIGPKLPLVCQLHQNTRTLVSCEEDFLKVSEGGCDMKCGELLTCGHVCPKQCHVVDREHVAYNCLEKCTKFCDKDPDHKCRKFCYKECGPCAYTVRRLLKCGHEVAVPCHIDLEKYNCLEPVEKTLKCGHEVAVPCHLDLEKYNCLEPVETTLKCGHVINKPCSEAVETFECTQMCNQMVEPCGHTCTKPCHVFDDPEHEQYKCMEMCTKYRIGCSLQEEKKHRCPNRCFEKCRPCLLNMYKKLPGCSHMLKVPCNADIDKYDCRKPCRKVLECGHKCQGKCSETCPPCKIHQKLNSQSDKVEENKPTNNKVSLSLSLRDSHLDDVKLNWTENAWRPARFVKDETESEDDVKTEMLYKKVRGILNKLTPQKFETLVSQVRELIIDTEARLQSVIDLVFNKAVHEPNFSVAYALMCRELALMQVPASNSTEDKKQFVNFRKLLINRCQQEFERQSVYEKERSDRVKAVNECQDTEHKKDLQFELEEYDRKCRMKSVGNIRFIGELFKQNMLTVNIMLRCLNNLLDNKEEESLECLCTLLTTVGKELETKQVSLDSIFTIMKEIVDKKDMKVSFRVRFLVEDVIDLRLSKWVPRRQDLKPSTIDQIQKKAGNGRGNLRQNSEQKGKRNVSNDGWTYTGPSRERFVPFTVQSDKKLKPQPEIEKLSLGSNNLFSNWGKVSNIMTEPLAPTNIYAKLINNQNSKPYSSKGHIMEHNSGVLFDGRGSRSGSQHRSNNSSSSSSQKSTPAPVSAPAAPVEQLSEEQLERRVKTSLDKYLNDTTNIDAFHEDTILFVPVSYLPNLVTNAHCLVLERSTPARIKTGCLFATLIKTDRLPLDAYCAGVQEIFNTADEFIINIPKFWECAAELLISGINMEVLSLSKLKNMVPADYCSKLLAPLFRLVISDKGPNFLQKMWQTSALKFTDLMPENQVNEFVKNNQLDFLVGDNVPVGQSQLTFEQIQNKLGEFFETDASPDDIVNWISANVGDRMKEIKFIRVLATAIFEHSVNKNELISETLKKHSTLLKNYVGNNANLELQCLYALQALINRMKHPQGLILDIFDHLYENSTLSLDSFIAWINSEDPAEQEGKRMALKQLERQ